MTGNMSLAALQTFLLLLVFTVASDAKAEGNNTRKPYIVHMMKSMKPQNFSLHEHWYDSLVEGVTSSEPHPVLLYIYDVVLHGFAAKLTTGEAKALENMEGCLAVIPSSINKMHTTRSPEFLGLASGSNDGHAGLWSQYSNRGEDVIVGMVDTGIWPESKSFDDEGLGPVPARWKGECESGDAFNSSSCNRKLIGARFNFSVGYKSHIGDDVFSARDSNGHGTHTASIAAGSAVSGASFNGFGTGTAVGMAPAARLAVYKACWEVGVDAECDESDVAAAMERAIEDGVDILSVSIGGADTDIFVDHKALAAFGAMEKGAFVSASAGNEGPFSFSVANTAPWITTVGASTIDREFPAPVTLGNSDRLKGSSLYKAVGLENLPLVYDYCSNQGLDPHIFKGKIVMCTSQSDSSEVARLVKEAGGAGVIVSNGKYEGADDSPIEQPYLPATSVSYWAGEKIKAYVNATAAPTATINPTGATLVGKATAPIVAAFSSRGPSTTFLEILKPDVVAPGVNILAAWTNGSFKIISGTSMSCPHVTGIAALIRAEHPTWSPAAIKSALMTSASTLDNRKRPIKEAFNLKAADPFAMGAGHVNPTAAINPGLVYDIGPQDYINFLCGLNAYTQKQLAMLSHKWPPCPKSKSAADLNYPSFSVVFKKGEVVQVKQRTVTNVGGENAVYRVRVKTTRNVKVSVEPQTLVLKKGGDRASFNVTFESKGSAESIADEFGDISWKCIQGEPTSFAAHLSYYIRFEVVKIVCNLAQLSP